MAAGAEVYLQASAGVWPNTMNISPGAGVSYNANGAIKIGNGNSTMTISGMLNLMGVPMATAPGDAIGCTGSGGTVVFSGQITGPGSLELDSQAGTGDSVTVNLDNTTANANNWAGSLLINPAASANASLYVKDVAGSQLNGNNVIISDNGTGTSRFDLDSHNDTIGALISGAPGSGNIEVDNAESGTSTLTVGANNAGGSFGGNIGQAGASINIVKTGAGAEILSGANTYNGNTTIAGGSLALSGNGSISNTPDITVAGGATFDVSALASGFTLGAAQVLSNSSSTATIAGNFNPGSGTLSLTYSAGTPSLMSSNGTFTLASTTPITIDNISGVPLAAGTYTIIANATSGNSGAVVGAAPYSVTVSGAGLAPGNLALLQINNNSLQMVVGDLLGIVSASATPSSITRFQSAFLSVTITNGAPPYSVTVNSSSLGDSGGLNLVQDGAEPAGVYVFTNTLTPSGTTPSGNYTLPVSITDTSGGTANGEISLMITPISLVWNGDAGGGSDWAGGVVEWQGGLSYEDGDSVRFDDTATGLDATNVNVSPVSPGGITVSNTAGLATARYTFAGAGPIEGATGLLKQGSGALIVDENNTYTGQTAISAGTVQVGVGNNGAGTLGGGAVTNNGSLVFDNPGNGQIVNNNISGAGSVTEEGADTLTLAGLDTFTGNVLVNNNSTLEQGSSNALGFNNTVTIASGSSLDLHGHAALNGNNIVVGGNGDVSTSLGAIDNNSTNAVYPALSNVTLTASATFGAASGRWDLRSPGGDGANPATSTLSTGGNPYNIVKTGPQFIGIVSTTVDPMLADIDVQNGTLDFEGNTTGLGNPTNTLTIEGYLFGTQGTFEMWNATNQLNKTIVLNDGGTLFNGSGANSLTGSMNITNSAGGEYCFFDIGGTSLTLSNTLTGNGTIYTAPGVGAGSLYINGNSPGFSGGIDMNAASPIIVDGVLSNALGVTVAAGTFTVNGQLLGAGVSGSGTITGSGFIDAPVNASGPVFPGASGVIGTLTVSNLTLQSSASVTFDLGPGTTAGGGVNDLIAVNGNLTANGPTININPIGLLQAGVPYCLFTYSGALSGSFTVNNSGGYAYTIDTSTQGVVNLIASGGPPVWDGGSTNGGDWSDSNNWNGEILAQNDNLLFSGTNRLINTNDTAAGTAYDNIEFIAGAGAFVLNGNNILLGGNGIVNDSTNAETFDLPLTINSGQTFNGASGPLIIGGGVTNEDSGLNVLTLTGTGILTNLLFNSTGAGTNYLALTGAGANWTVLDNASSTPMSVPWALEITNGTLTFGNAGSAPKFTSTTIHNVPQDSALGAGAGSLATLNIVNGTVAINTLDTAPSLNSTSILDVAGGTLDVGPIGSVSSDYFQGANGANAGEVSIVNISGGAMSVGGSFWVASRGSGTVTVSGTGSLTCGTFDISRNANGNAIGSVGVVNLNGGTITCSHVGTADANAQAGPAASGVNPSATFNFNGGTLQASASSGAFYQGSTAAPAIPIASYILAGGAVINDGGNSITFLEPLQSGATPDGGLAKLGAGTVTLGEANTYNGNTTISAGTLALGASGSIANSDRIVIAGGATFNVTALASPFALASSQVLSNSTSTATIAGSLNTGAGALSLTYAAGTPSLAVSSGTLTLAAGTGLTINNTGTPLAAGTYTLIAAGGGTVAGTPPSSYAVTGAGVAAGQPTSLQISGGALDLIVGTTASAPKITGISVNGTALTINATGGADGGQFVLLESTNLLLPMNQWTPVLTNNFNGSGNLANFSANVVNPNVPREFYLMQAP